MTTLPFGLDDPARIHALAPLPVALPLAFAALLGAGGRHTPRRLASAVAIVVAAIVTLASGLLLLAALDGRFAYWFGGFALRGGVPLGVAFVVDVGGALFATLAGLLATCSLIFAVRYFDTVGALFHALVLLFLAGVCGFCLTGDLFNLFVFFELMSTAAFALCAYKSEQAAPLQGGINFAVTSTVAASFIVLAIGLLYGRTGALDLAQLGRSIGATRDPLVVTAFALLVVAFAIKGALAPFHFWLADAHAVAPAPVCVLFSGVMVEVGVFAIARVHAAVFADAIPLGGATRAVLFALGAVTAIVGALMAFAQRHLKRLLAFSSVSHMGLALAGWSLGGQAAIAGALAYLVGHGLLKGALFFAAGLVLHTLRDVDEIQMRGRGRSHPVVAVVLGVAALGLASAPWGTLAGDATIAAAARDRARLYGLAYDAIAAFAAILTAGAVLRACLRVFVGLGTSAPEAPDVGGETGERPETTRSVGAPASMVAPPIALLGLALAFTFTPAARHAVALAAAQLADHRGYVALVLGEHAPPIASGPSTTLDLGHALLPSLAAIALALVTLLRQRIFAPPLRAFGVRLEQVFGVPLRRAHSGHIGDQVAWLVLGAAVLTCALLATAT